MCFVTGYSQKKTAYSDTIFQYDQMRISCRGLAYRGFGRFIMNVTNLTDSFKIIHSADVSIADIKGQQIPIISKIPCIVPPKATRRFSLVAEAKDFKGDFLKIVISNIHTTGEIDTIYDFQPISLELATFKLIDEKKQFPTLTNGALTVKLNNYEYFMKGNVGGQLVVSYTGNKFLSIYAKNITLQTPEGKIYVNHRQTMNSLSYINGKKEMKLVLDFENPNGASREMKGDKLILENVFIEYNTYSLNKPLELKLYKKGEEEFKGEEEKKEDIEMLQE